MAYSLRHDPVTGVVVHDGVIRDADGAFVPNDPDNADWHTYLDWVRAGGVTTVCAPPAVPLTVQAEAVRAECGRLIVEHIGGAETQASMQREATYLLQLVAAGQALSDEQHAEAAMFIRINQWETAMVDAREVAIANELAVGAVPWPPAPPGLAAFRNGF